MEYRNKVEVAQHRPRSIVSFVVGKKRSNRCRIVSGIINHPLLVEQENAISCQPLPGRWVGGLEIV